MFAFKTSLQAVIYSNKMVYLLLFLIRIVVFQIDWIYYSTGELSFESQDSINFFIFILQETGLKPLIWFFYATVMRSEVSEVIIEFRFSFGVVVPK